MEVKNDLCPDPCSCKQSRLNEIGPSHQNVMKVGERLADKKKGFSGWE